MASMDERQKKAPDSSNEALKKLFEARVAVMGFKCRVMQLQGELEAQRKELRENSGVLARDEMERLERENVRLKSELAEARKDHLKAQKLAEGYKGECQSLVRDYQTAGEQIKTMEGQIRSLEEERDHYRRQADMSQRELAIQADRIKALEAQLQPMNLQAEYTYWRSNSYK